MSLANKLIRQETHLAQKARRKDTRSQIHDIKQANPKGAERHSLIHDVKVANRAKKKTLRQSAKDRMKPTMTANV